MPIDYTLAERGYPAQPTAAKKFYATARSTGETTVRGLAKRISGISTVSTVDVMAVLEAFFQTMPEELADSHIVRFGDFGLFFTSLESEGADTEKEFNATLVNSVRAKFRPGRLFAQAM